MKIGRFRRMTAAELQPFRGRSWTTWGAEEASFELEGVSLHVDGHAAPILFVWSFAAGRGDDRGTPVYSHVPYPHTLTPEARRMVMDLQAHDGGFSGFVRLIEKRATLLD